MKVHAFGGDATAAQILVAAGALGRSLQQRGWRVGSLCPADPGAARVSCPEGGTVSRPAAILAECFGNNPAPFYELNGRTVKEAVAALPAYGFDFVIAVSLDAQPAGAGLFLSAADGLHVQAGGADFGRLTLPPFIEITPQEDQAHLALPPYAPGRPRIGIVSLPHLVNFPQYAVFRGAEWIAAVPPGSFDFVILPETSNAASDRDWVNGRGLVDWLAMQKMAGARILSFGDTFGGLAQFASVADLGDYRAVSRMIGARLSAPLPDEDTYDRLARWWDSGIAMDRLEKHLLHAAGMIVE